TDMVHDEFAQLVLGDSPLGRPVLGTVESISSISRAAVAGYYRRRYLPDTMVIAAAGNLDHARVVRLVRKALTGTAFLGGQARPRRPREGSVRAGSPRARLRTIPRPTEQANLVL